MSDNSIRRREFLKASGAATAGLAAGMLAVSARAVGPGRVPTSGD